MYLKTLSKEELTAIKTFSKNLRKDFAQEVKTVYLFGSKARGDFHRNSDIDLLVITKTDDWKLGDRIRRVGYALDEEIEFRFSILVMPEYQFQYQKEKQFQFIQNVIRDGVEL